MVWVKTLQKMHRGFRNITHADIELCQSKFLAGYLIRIWCVISLQNVSSDMNFCVLDTCAIDDSQHHYLQFHIKY